MRGRRRGIGVPYGAVQGGGMAPPRAGTARPPAQGAPPRTAVRRRLAPQGGVSVRASASPPAAVLGLARRGHGTAERRGRSGEPARSGSAGDLMINSRRRWLRLVSGSSCWPAAARGGRRVPPSLQGRGRRGGSPFSPLLTGALRFAAASWQPQGQSGTLLGTVWHCPYFLNSQCNFVGVGTKYLFLIRSSGRRVFALLSFSTLTKRWQERITEIGPCFFQRTELSVGWMFSLITATSTVLINSR